MADREESPADRMKWLYGPVPGEDAAQTFVRIFKKIIFDTMVREVPDQLLHPGQDEALSACIERIVDARLIADKIPVGRQLRKELIASILADIHRAGGERFPEGN